MRLILIRHGRTRANDDYLYCGSTDLPLSDSGREELMRRRAEGGYPSAVGLRIYSSGLLRTEETLELLYKPLRHTVLPAMREMDFGRFEMHSYDQLKEDPVYRAWCDGDNEANVTPGGESGELMRARVLAALEELIGKGEDALIVTHGGPIAAVMAHLFPGEGKNRFDWQPKNGAGYEIILTDQERSWRPIPTGGDA